MLCSEHKQESVTCVCLGSVDSDGCKAGGMEIKTELFSVI